MENVESGERVGKFRFQAQNLLDKPSPLVVSVARNLDTSLTRSGKRSLEIGRSCGRGIRDAFQCRI